MTPSEQAAFDEFCRAWEAYRRSQTAVTNQPPATGPQTSAERAAALRDEFVKR